MMKKVTLTLKRKKRVPKMSKTLHEMHEKKYHQVSPALQRSDYQIFMCDTLLKKSLTKYHQVSPTFLVIIPYKHLSVYCLYIRIFVGSFMYLFCVLAVFVTFETPRFVP